MYPFIRIGQFYIPTYGLLVATAFLAGVWTIGRLSRRSGLNADKAMNLAIYAALIGIAGAKALMVAFDFKYYAANPGELFSLTTLQAGGIFFGGLVFALAYAVFYVKRNRMQALPVADVFAPAIALGHGIGRLGCFSAGCCYGTESHWPLSVIFTNPESHERFGTPLGVPLYPTQLMESFAEFAIFAFLYRRFGRRHGPGAIISLYLMLYPGVRFLVEFVRAHDSANPFYGPLVFEQWVALGLVALGAVVYARSRKAAPVRMAEVSGAR